MKRLKLSNLRREYRNYFINKYYMLWMNRYNFKELSYQQNDWIFKKLWATPSVAGFLLKETIGSTANPNGTAVFCPYAPALYNIYDYPTKVSLINVRGVSFIPTTLQEVDKDVVLFYSNRNKKSIYELIEPLIERLALIECVIKINLNANKTPFLFSISPEDEEKIKKLWDDIEEDEERIYITSEDFDKIKNLISGIPYILDKLYALEDKVEAQIKEILGFKAMQNQEKKEHLITSEVESNDEFTEYCYYAVKDIIEESAQRFTDVFGFTLTLEEKHINEIETPEEKVVQEDAN